MLEQHRDQSAESAQRDTKRQGSHTPITPYQVELAASADAGLPDDIERLELLTEQELREGETDDPTQAIEEDYTYVPPNDPPITPGGPQNAQIAGGLGSASARDAYDERDASLPLSDDELAARVREALRADNSTNAYANRIAITVDHGRVVLRGEVDDMFDSDNLLAVAGVVAGVEEVVDRLRIRGL